MVKKIILIIVLLPILLWVLSPKKELLYLLEKQLAKQGVVLSDGTIREHPFGLTIEHPSLYFKGIKVATADTISFWSVLAYTQGTIDTVAFDPSLHSYLPEKIEKVLLVHNVLDPNTAVLSIIDSAFTGEGSVEIMARKVHMLFPTLSDKSALTRYLKHTKGGWTYEQRF